jgi:nanoRNase/pAp phosphatase (c-di-AMP/oligoRNAs hydrolase)
MLRMKGKTWSLCTGIFEDRMYLSIRTANSRADAGQLMRRLLGRRGKGGGHGMMAGGWIPIADPSQEASRALHDSIVARLAKFLKKNPDKLAPVLTFHY